MTSQPVVQPVSAPEGSRLILASEDLFSFFGTMTTDGRRLTYEWGEPDANGWYTPTVTEHEPPALRDLRVAATEMADAYRDIEGDVINGRTDNAYVALSSALRAAAETNG